MNNKTIKNKKIKKKLNKKKKKKRANVGWVAIHMCVKATLRISLYNYLYLKLAKTLYLSYYLLCFLFNKIVEEEGRTEGRGLER
jgi:hypothetical protein